MMRFMNIYDANIFISTKKIYLLILMPFKSASQLRTCYSLRPKGWDCDKWLKETLDIGCLPERKGKPRKRACRPQRKHEKIKGPVQVGPRGGKFFIIKQGGDEIKIYIKRKKK